MITYFVPLLASFLRPEWLRYWFYPLIAMAFIVTCGRLLHEAVLRW